MKDRFDPIAMSTMNALLNGGRNVEDSLGICRLCTPNLALTLECINAVTGWEWTVEDAKEMGLRIVNLMRMFNFRHGLTKEMEAPSVRYSSTPVDGPAAGHRHPRALGRHPRQLLRADGLGCRDGRASARRRSRSSGWRR